MSITNDPSSPGSDSRVQNTLTDCIDLLLEKGWKSVTLTSGTAPIFQKDTLRFNAPELNDPIEEQDLNDYLEALGLNFPTARKSLPYMYRSARFNGSLFSLDFFPDDRNNAGTTVQFIWMGC
jgi:hypothetical protein